MLSGILTALENVLPSAELNETLEFNLESLSSDDAEQISAWCSLENKKENSSLQKMYQKIFELNEKYKSVELLFRQEIEFYKKEQDLKKIIKLYAIIQFFKFNSNEENRNIQYNPLDEALKQWIMPCAPDVFKQSDVIESKSAEGIGLTAKLIVGAAIVIGVMALAWWLAASVTVALLVGALALECGFFFFEKDNYKASAPQKTSESLPGSKIKETPVSTTTSSPLPQESKRSTSKVSQEGSAVIAGSIPQVITRLLNEKSQNNTGTASQNVVVLATDQPNQSLVPENQYSTAVVNQSVTSSNHAPALPVEKSATPTPQPESKSYNSDVDNITLPSTVNGEKKLSTSSAPQSDNISNSIAQAASVPSQTGSVSGNGVFKKKKSVSFADENNRPIKEVYCIPNRDQLEKTASYSDHKQLTEADLLHRVARDSSTCIVM